MGRFGGWLMKRRFEALLEAAVQADRDGRPATALEKVREAIALSPDEATGDAFLGWATLRNGDPREARAAFGRFVRRVGRRRFRMGDEAPAGCLVLGALLCRGQESGPHPFAPAVAGFLSRAYLELGRVHRSRSWIRRALALEDKDAEILYQRGVLATLEEADRSRAIRAGVDWLLKADTQDPDFLHKRIARLRERLEASVEGR